MAVYTLLMTSPLVLAALLLWGGRPTVSLASARPRLGVERLREAAEDLAATARPPAISISIEPTALVPYAEAEPPVVLPGYLLPDDGCEEPPHAGS